MTKRNLPIVFLALAAAALVVIPATSAQSAPAPEHVHGSQQRASQAAPGAAALKEMEAHAGYSMNPATSDPHPWCDGAVWSTFNHRVAGCYLALWGFAALIAGLQGPPGTWWRFAPSVVLLGLVQFLFFRNDPEAWPVGPLSFWDSLQGEDLQHRVFLLLLLAIAVVELLRAGSRLPEFFAKYSVAILAGLGGVYLFFHNHGGEDMSRATTEASMQQMMASMNTVLHEHMWFSVLGFGVAGSRLLGDARILKGQWGACLWTVFAITLGVYMTYYVE